MQKLTLPEGVTEIGSLYSSQGVFGDCYGLQQINLPSTLRIIGAHTFENCWNLPSVSIPSGVTDIGDYAFSGNYWLEKADLRGVSVIEGSAFASCSRLKEVQLGDGLKTLGTGAFSNCVQLKRLYLPDRITKIEEMPHSYGSTTLVARKGTTTASRLRAYSISFVEPLMLQMPTDIERIESEAFCGSTAEAVVIPEGCVSIDARAFADMPSLHYVVLPESVTEIAEDAFEGSPVMCFVQE